VKALDGLLETPDLTVRGQAFKTMGVWGTPEVVPRLLKLLEESDNLNRGNVIYALGRLRDERAIAPVAKLLADPSLRREAGEALRQFGPKAEPAVLPYLAHADLYVRLDACRLLKDIGTKESVPALEKHTADKTPILAHAAKEAIDAINGRAAAGGPMP
jgi:HEAT repeat protein